MYTVLFFTSGVMSVSAKPACNSSPAGAARRRRANHRVTENTEKAKEKSERGNLLYIFILFLSVFSVSRWLALLLPGAAFAVEGFVAQFVGPLVPLPSHMTDRHRAVEASAQIAGLLV